MPTEKKAPLRLFGPPWALTMYERLRQPHPLPTWQTTTVPITPQLENHFTCALCYDLFTETMTTSCLHRFCKNCIIDWWSKEGVTKRCPFCNKKCASKRDLRPDLTTDAFVKLLFPNGKCTNDHLEMNLKGQDDQMSDMTTEITKKTLTRDLPTVKEEPSINSTLNTLGACQEGDSTRKIMPKKASNSKSQKLNDNRKIQGTATRKPAGSTQTSASTPQQPSKRLTTRKVQGHESDHRLNESGCQFDVSNAENSEITISDSEEEKLSILGSPPQMFFNDDEPTNVPFPPNARVIDSDKLVSNPGSSKIVSSPTNNTTQQTVKHHFLLLNFSPNDGILWKMACNNQHFEANFHDTTVNEMTRQTNTTNSPSDCCVRIGFDNEPLDSGSEEEAPIGSDHLTYDDQEIEHEFSAEDNIKKPRGKSKRPFRFLESDDDSQDDQPKAPMFGTFQSRVNAFSKISPPPKAQSSIISTEGGALLNKKKSTEKEDPMQVISPPRPLQSRLTPSSSSKKQRRSTSPIDEFDELQEFLDENESDSSLGDLFERRQLSKSQGRSFGKRSAGKAKLTTPLPIRRRTSMKHPVSAPVTAGKKKWTKLLQVEEAKKREKEERKRAKEERRPCHLEAARFANINIEDNPALKAIEVAGLQVKDPNRFLRDTWLNKFRNTLFKRIDEVPREEQEPFREQLDTLCLAIEKAVWENNRKYKSQNVRLFHNLADPRNSTFFRDVLYGNITPEQLANMDASEMASDELKQERQMENDKLLEAYKKGSDERNDSEKRQRLKKNHKGVNIIEQMEGPLELDVPEDYGNITVPKIVPTSTMESDVVSTANCPLLSELQTNPNATSSRILHNPSTSSCQSHQNYSDKSPSPPNSLAVPESPVLDEYDHEDGGIFDNSYNPTVQPYATPPIDQLQNTFPLKSSKKRVRFSSTLVSGKSPKRNLLNLVSALKRPRLNSDGGSAQQLPKPISQIEQSQPRNAFLETSTAPDSDSLGVTQDSNLIPKMTEQLPKSISQIEQSQPRNALFARDSDSLRVTQDSNLTAIMTEPEQTHQSGISNLLNSVVSKFMNTGIQDTSSSAAQPSTFARVESHPNVSQIAVWNGDIINEMDKKTCQVSAVPLTLNSKFPRWFMDSNIKSLGFCISNNIDEQQLLGHIEQGSDVAIVRFEPKISDQHPYTALFQFFTVRSSTVLQVGFVRLSGTDFAHNAFIYPLAKETPLPRYLANYLGSSLPLPHQRPDMLLGILTRQKSDANKCSAPSASNNQNQFADSVRVSANIGSVPKATLPTNPLEMDSSAMAMLQRQFLLSQQTNHSQTGSLGAQSMSLNNQPLPSGISYWPTTANLPTQPSQVSAGGPDPNWTQYQFTREPQAGYGTSYQALPGAPYGLGVALNPSHSQLQPTFYQKPTYKNHPLQHAGPNIVSMHGSSSVPPATMRPLVSEPDLFGLPTSGISPYETNNLYRHGAQFGNLQPYTAVSFPVNQQPPPGHMYQQRPPHDPRMS